MVLLFSVAFWPAGSNEFDIAALQLLATYSFSLAILQRFTIQHPSLSAVTD